MLQMQTATLARHVPAALAAGGGARLAGLCLRTARQLRVAQAVTRGVTGASGTAGAGGRRGISVVAHAAAPVARSVALAPTTSLASFTRADTSIRLAVSHGNASTRGLWDTKADVIGRGRGHVQSGQRARMYATTAPLLASRRRPRKADGGATGGDADMALHDDRSSSSSSAGTGTDPALGDFDTAAHADGTQHGEATDDASVEAELQTESDPDAVIPTLARVQDIVGYDLKFPRIISIGNQSAGKSSCLESIIGLDILPKGGAMVTRRPLEVTLLRTRSGTWVEFPGGDKEFSLDRARERILEENMAVELSTEPLRIKVFAPHVHNLTLCDLPGYINAIRPGQSLTLPQQITDLCTQYTADERNLMMVVVSATDDLANSVALREAQQHDPQSSRSMGVVVKCDLPKHKGQLIDTLQNRNYPLGLGYIGVRCRTQLELEEGVTFSELEGREAEFFNGSGIADELGVRVGTPRLRLELSRALLRKVSARFPEILAKLDGAIAEAKRNENFLQTLAQEKDLKTVARELESLVKQLHPTAPSRKAFEQHLRQRLHAEVGAMWDDAACRHYDGLAASIGGSHASATRSYEAEWRPVTDTPKEAAKGVTIAAYQPSNVRGPANTVLRGLRSAGLPSTHRGSSSTGTSTSDGGVTPYRDLFVYGGAPLDRADNDSLEAVRRQGIATGSTAAFYRHTYPSDLVDARHRFHNNLERTVDELLATDDVDEGFGTGVAVGSSSSSGHAGGHSGRVMSGGGNLADRCFDVLMGELVAFADTADTSARTSEAHSQLARSFFRFLFERVATRIHGEGLSETIRGMIDREKRPYADFLAVQHELAQQIGHPRRLDGLFGDHNVQLDVPLYSPEWMDAYFSVVKARTADDVFRILAVRLLEPLIFECISYSLNLFRTESVLREASRHSDYLAELEGYRQVIARAADKYHE